MLKETEVFEAFKAVLEAAPEFENIAWPNGLAESNTPRLEVEFSISSVGEPKTDYSTRVRGFAQITVVGAANEFTNETQAIAAQVVSYFKLNAVIGPARIYRRPTVPQGYLDNEEWRVPITIPFEFFDDDGTKG